MKPRPGLAPYILNSASRVQLYIYDSGRFDLGDMSIPKSGTVAYDGMKAVLTVRKIAGADVERQSEATRDSIGPIELEMQPDGTLNYLDPKSMDPSLVKLKRIATSVKDRP